MFDGDFTLYTFFRIVRATVLIGCASSLDRRDLATEIWLLVCYFRVIVTYVFFPRDVVTRSVFDSAVKMCDYCDNLCMYLDLRHPVR